MDREKIIEDYLSRHIPEMVFGNMANDDGNLIIEAEDLDAFIERDPRSKKFIRRYMMTKEFIQNIPRYCLWLVDATPTEMRSIKPIRERVEACRKYRLASKRSATQKLADTPWLFGEIRQPANGNILVVPVTSSERRDYIPIGFLDSETIIGILQMIPNGSLDLFGILTSSVHMAWMRVVGGKLKNDYRYSSQLVYNNFPFHKPTPEITITAKRILDARAKYPDASMADLYDPNLMPIELRKAHRENDLAVLDCYGFPRDSTDDQISTKLLEIYSELVKIVDGGKS